MKKYGFGASKLVMNSCTGLSVRKRCFELGKKQEKKKEKKQEKKEQKRQEKQDVLLHADFFLPVLSAFLLGI